MQVNKLLKIEYLNIKDAGNNLTDIKLFGRIVLIPVISDIKQMIYRLYHPMVHECSIVQLDTRKQLKTY